MIEDPMTETVNLVVEGMTCGGCENAVRRVLQNTTGVDSVTPSHRDARVEVRFDPAQVPLETIREKISSLGYSVQP
ncbi:MAG: cation transporter [Vicinamibacterales bacterium]